MIREFEISAVGVKTKTERVADPAKVGMARHNGKVERQVPAVRQRLMAGRSYANIEEANGYALTWCWENSAFRPGIG